MSQTAARIVGLSAIVEGEGWNESTLLGLALDFINQESRGPAFLQHCNEQATSLAAPIQHKGDSALAVAAVAEASQSDEEDWEFIDGPETGVGNEFWLEHSSGETAYVCVDQGEVVSCTFHDAQGG